MDIKHNHPPRFYPKILLSTANVKSYALKLLIDNREKKRNANHSSGNQSARIELDSSLGLKYFESKLLNAGISCETCPLPVGDFLWVVDIEHAF